MYIRGHSGQFLHFPLVNVSGSLQALASGAISGRKILDANPQVLLSGNIVETSGGMYRVNFHGHDVSGDNIGYLFTASGCLPVSYNVVTIDSASGRFQPASGAFAAVPPSALSGLNAIVPPVNLSGLNAIVPPANLSGLFATVPPVNLSGLNAIVLSANLSGLFSQVPPATISGAVMTLLSGSMSGVQTVISDVRYVLRHAITGSGLSGFAWRPSP